MVSSPRITGGAQVLSAGVRKTIQSLKEIVGNHSDADIYAALKETNMDPNETAQKLLNQDPFHEVKRKREKKKENLGSQSFAAADPRKNSEVVHMLVKYNANSDRNVRRGGYTRKTSSGSSREFRVVRDNRINENAVADSKPANNSTLPSEWANGPVKSNSTVTSVHQKLPIGRRSSEAFKDVTSDNNDRKDPFPIPIAASRVQTKANDSHPHATNSPNSSLLGVYPSASDPVHVPSLHRRPSANVGAIKREIGPRRQSSENSAKNLSSQLGQESESRESMRPITGSSKSELSSQNTASGSESAVPGSATGKSFSSNQYGGRPHQFVAHQKAPHPNKEWKPKSGPKPRSNCPTVIGSPAKTVSPAAENPANLSKESVQIQDNMSLLNISDSQNVIIAAHIRVSEVDRNRLTFGSLGTELDSSINLVIPQHEGAEEVSAEPSGSVSASAAESSSNEPAATKHLESITVSGQNSGSNSPGSGAVSHHLTEKKESTSPQNLNNYADVGLVQGNSQSYALESTQQPDTSELPSFSGYDPQVGYDISYLRPMADETFRGQGLTSPQEVSSFRTPNTGPTSTISMVQQQQQQQLAQMYNQVHVSHYANLIPYHHRQFLSPVYVPPMPVPGYSSSPTAYPHPSNANSYVLVPGNGTHMNPNGIKYGVQQFKPVPGGSPTGFGNFPNLAGYAAVNTQTGHEDSSQIKYKDGLYVPNAQAETSEMWMNARDHPSLQSGSYYNLPAQTPHGAYLPSHNGHGPFAAAAQSSHMQFPGMYHSPTQPAAMASPHHNVGVGVAAPAPHGAQVGPYQQTQLGHMNWNGNF